MSYQSINHQPMPSNRAGRLSGAGLPRPRKNCHSQFYGRSSCCEVLRRNYEFIVSESRIVHFGCIMGLPFRMITSYFGINNVVVMSKSLNKNSSLRCEDKGGHDIRSAPLNTIDLNSGEKKFSVPFCATHASMCIDAQKTLYRAFTNSLLLVSRNSAVSLFLSTWSLGSSDFGEFSS